MLALPAESQIRLYAVLRTMETRAHAVQSQMGRLKRSCVHGGAGAMADLVAMAAELRWQMRQLDHLVDELQSKLGMSPAAAKPAATPTQQEEQPSISGSTKALDVCDLVNMLHMSGKTGTLTLHGEETMFVFEFQEGRVVHAVTNNTDPEARLGSVLVALEKVSRGEMDQHVIDSVGANSMLGAYLVDQDILSPESLHEALDVQVHAIFGAAFQLESARFHFAEGRVSDLKQRTIVGTTQLLLEAARLKDEQDNDDDDLRTLGALDSVLEV